MTRWIIIGAIGVLCACGGAGGGGGGGAACDASNCAGCCQAGTCVTGNTTSACGAGGTTCTSCPAGYSCTSGVCKGCTAHGDCATQTDVCIGGACTAGFERTYVVTVESVTLPTQTASGSAWDPFGGAPDPQICVYLDGSTAPASCSPYVDDTFTANLNWSFEVLLKSTTKVDVFAWDYDDGSSNDPVEGFFWADGGSFISTLRAGGIDGKPFTEARVTWKVKIAPKP